MSATLNPASHTRIVPGVIFDVRRPQRMLERSAMVYRKSWMILVSGFFEPLFYLLSIRIGLSALVGDLEVDGRLVAYDQFVAPGLMAASAMNGAVFDSTMNIFHKMKHSKLYDAVLATPMSAGDVAVGEISFAVVRGALYSTATDMARFLSMYMDSGRGEREQIISDEHYTSLLTPEVVAIDDDRRVRHVEYALGHYTYVTPENVRVLFHAGGNPGLRSVFVLCPDRDIGFFAVAIRGHLSGELSQPRRGKLASG